ncbi:MAG: oxidoreductase [Candidatus Goldbacteria bacterium]|nr:oxidoreductase [Candidatus Goldiibacteriota bacterium]HPD18316.1 oxidoreductase [Candidatus Goldiibacteriota bacterium]
MSNKTNLAIYWAGSCGGCDVSILDLNDRILEIGEKCNVKLWPIAMDFKLNDVEGYADNSIDVCLFNGCVRNSEQEHMAKLLRKKSKILIAFGSCAYLGGIPGMANFYKKQEILDRVYVEAQSVENSEKIYPQPQTKVNEGELEIPVFHDFVKSLNQVVEVDYFIPGCPPTTEIINAALDALFSGNLPPKGSVIAGKKNLCEECPRIKSEEKKVKKFKRPYEIIPDEKKCLLEQGIICMGPATIGGCGAKCINANMPCRGCFGPAPLVSDIGAKMLSAVASVIDSNDPEEIEKIINEIPDTAGTFYRFSLPVSLLRRAK